MPVTHEESLALRLGPPAGSFPAPDSLGPEQQKRLGAAVDAATLAHEQALQMSLPFWLRGLLRALVRRPQP